jgi:hypothetical protein
MMVMVIVRTRLWRRVMVRARLGMRPMMMMARLRVMVKARLGMMVRPSPSIYKGVL